MNLPIDTIDGTLAFAVRGAYAQRVYPANIGNGGGHFPATSVCVVYQLGGRSVEDSRRTLLSRMLEQLPSDGSVLHNGDRRGDDMGDMIFIGALPGAKCRNGVAFVDGQSRCYKQPYRVYAAHSTVYGALASSEAMGRYYIMEVYEI